MRTRMRIETLLFQESKQLTQAPELIAVPSVAEPRPAPRPSYSVLDCARAEALGIARPDWRLALKELAATWSPERKAA